MSTQNGSTSGGPTVGATVRQSATPIVNVASGGGETGFFVLQEQGAS